MKEDSVHFETNQQDTDELDNLIEESNNDLGDWVVVNFEGKRYSGIITALTTNGAVVRVMYPCLGGWVLPNTVDEIEYSSSEIVKRNLDAPVEVNRCGGRLNSVTVIVSHCDTIQG